MDIDTMVENHFKKKALNEDLIKEVMQFLLAEKKDTKKERAPSPGELRRARTLRFPLIIPAEQSVGQYTTDEGSEDRRTFEIWMSKLGKEGGNLGDKIKAIQKFIDNPPEGLTLATTLSYLMFLQTFSFMIREFNASVAGFLWEPFLAALFGEDSKQVHTEEGDISDVRITAPAPDGGQMNVSLKILREAGGVGGSFQDLVNHFADNPGQPMIYVVIRKLATTGKDDETIKDAHMVFWQFEINEDTFFEYIGHPKRRKEFVEASFEMVLSKDYTASALAGGTQKARQSEEWAKQNYEKGSRARAILNPENDQPIKGRIPAGAAVKVLVDSVTFVPGKPGPGAVLSAKANAIWGTDEEYAQWFDWWLKLKAEGNMQTFWQMVQGPTPKRAAKGPGREGPPWAPGGARGYIKSEQFEINANYQSTIAKDLGTIDITPSKLEETFTRGAASIGDDLTEMFNALSALVDNIGRFFLIDCGDPQEESQTCDEKDAATRSTAGHASIKDAATLKKVVDIRIATEFERAEAEERDPASGLGGARSWEE